MAGQFDTDRTKFIKYNNNLNEYYYFPDQFSDDDIMRVDQLMGEKQLEEGNTAGVID